MTRRRALGAGLAVLCGAGGAGTVSAAADSRGVAAAQHFPFGPVLPKRPAPPLALRSHLDAATDLSALLRGRVSAVQLMFTGCSATCPIQGALFAQAQGLLGGSLPAVQFVSLSIDPLGDTPVALAAWLRRFDARAGWLAAVPRVGDAERLIAWLGEGGEPRPRGSDPHTGQVYLVDERGELAFRTPSMPPAADIAAALRRLATKP
jgi:protein SCO1/2